MVTVGNCSWLDHGIDRRVRHAHYRTYVTTSNTNLPSFNPHFPTNCHISTTHTNIETNRATEHL